MRLCCCCRNGTLTVELACSVHKAPVPLQKQAKRGKGAAPAAATADAWEEPDVEVIEVEDDDTIDQVPYPGCYTGLFALPAGVTVGQRLSLSCLAMLGLVRRQLTAASGLLRPDLESMLRVQHAWPPRKLLLVQGERDARQVARAALRQLNEALEARRGTNRQILENTVVEALARARPTSVQALAAQHISKFSANTRDTYGSQIISTLKQVWHLGGTRPAHGMVCTCAACWDSTEQLAVSCSCMVSLTSNLCVRVVQAGEAVLCCRPATSCSATGSARRSLLTASCWTRASSSSARFLSALPRARQARCHCPGSMPLPCIAWLGAHRRWVLLCGNHRPLGVALHQQ